MIIDVTDSIHRYRCALRHIWNSCIWVDPILRNWDSVYSWRDLKLPLFKALVADPLGLQTEGSIFGQSFKIVPDVDAFPSLQINLRVPSSATEGIWEPINGPFNADEVTLTLVDLFDWSPLGYIDLRYFVVQVQYFRGRPEKEGQHALIDVNHANVLYEDKNINSGDIPGSLTTT